MKGYAGMTTVRVIGGCIHDLSEFVWRKSSWTRDGECVEVALRDSVFVRDSKNPGGGILAFPRTRWAQFVDAAVTEQFLSGK